VDLRSVAVGYIEDDGLGSRQLWRQAAGDHEEKDLPRLPSLTRRSSSSWECVDHPGLSGNHSFPVSLVRRSLGLDGVAAGGRAHRLLRRRDVAEDRCE